MLVFCHRMLLVTVDGDEPGLSAVRSVGLNPYTDVPEPGVISCIPPTVPSVVHKPEYPTLFEPWNSNWPS